MKKSPKKQLIALNSSPLKSMANFEAFLAVFILFILFLTNSTELKDTSSTHQAIQKKTSTLKAKK
ncbi:MAG: hypothetical protein M9962_04310 [Oligoflexia bacterium]|nr:hypothetical protein [Oligoflexia bacterium]